MITIRLAAEQSFYVTGGTLRRDAPSYVERQADQALYDGLLEGKFCYVLTSRQMGKSSLMVRTAARLREDGVGVAVLDLTAVGQNLTAEQWYDGLLGRIGQQLHLEDELEEFWLSHSRLGPLQRWMRAITEVVLPRRPGRLAIFVDEIDVVRSLVDFSTDEFFAGIREFYNRRTEEPELERLSFCLLGVATPSNLISDTRTTPFNIGQRVELNDFTETEAMPLARGLGHDEKTSSKLLNRVLHWTGGHPYLTQRLCQAVAKDGTVKDADGVDRICAKLFLTPRARERDDNLLFVRERMLHGVDDPAALLDLYNKIRNHKRVKDDEANPLVSVLRLSGVTRVNDGQLNVRNRIYSRVFDQEWVQSNMPGAELRRQRAAYRHGRWRAAAIAAIIVAAVSSLTVWAFIKLDEAKKQKEQIEKQKLDLEEQKRELEKQKKKADEEKKKAEQSANKARLEEKRADEQSRIASDKATEAEKERDRAEDARVRAEEEEQKNRRLFYASDMKVAAQAWETAQVEQMKELLDRYKPKPGRNREDLRNFEWYYLWRLCQNEPSTLRHPGRVLSVAFSPDGKWLASGSADHNVRIWDAVTKRELFQLKGHSDLVTSVSFSPDGKVLASGSWDHSVKLWDVTTGKKLYDFNGHDGVVLSAIFSSDGKKLASGDAHGIVKLWDVAAGIETATLNKRKEHVWLGAFSPDGRRLALGGNDGYVKIWDATTGDEFFTLKGHTRPVSVMTYSTDGKWLASGSEDGVVTLWDVVKRKVQGMLKMHANAVLSLIFSPNGERLASGGDDRIVKLWNVAQINGQRLDTEAEQEPVALLGHTSQINSLAFSPDGKNLASGSNDDTIKLWNAPLEQERPLLEGHSKFVSSVAFSPDGTLMASGSGDGCVILWDVVKRQKLRQVNGQAGAVFSVSFSPDGKLLAVGGFGGMRLWEVASGLELRKPASEAGIVLSVAFSPDGRNLATGSRDKILRLWDAVTGQKLWANEAHLDMISSVAFSPDGKILASGSWDRTVKLWDAGTGKKLPLEGKHEGKVYTLAFSPDKHEMKLASGDDNRTIKLWDVNTGKEVVTFKGHSERIHSIAFSPDGERLVSGSWDRSVKLWYVKTGQEILALKGHADSVLAVAFSPDGNMVASASGSNERIVRLWPAAAKSEDLFQGKK